MKKALLFFALVIVVSTGISYAMAQWAASRSRQPSPSVHDAAWLKRELNLTGAQTAEADRHAREFHSQVNSCCKTHCDARAALSDELAKPTVNVETARACVEKMNAAAADAEMATLAHILKIRALLTPEQAQRYASIIQQQVCNMPMGTP